MTRTASTFALLFALAVPAHAGLTVTERTKNYSIRGATAADFARAMSRRGPYSRQHRQRVWATATRSLSYNIVPRRVRGGCVVDRANVRLTISYTLPKLLGENRLRPGERKRWRRMLSLLTAHEKVHGRYYRDLGKQTERALRKLPRARNCRTLQGVADATVDRLSARNQALNDRFDRNDRRRYRRMESIYSLRTQ